MLGEDGRNIKELSLDNVVIPDVGEGVRLCLSRHKIHTEVLVVSLVRLDHLEEHVLLVEPRVLSQGAGNNQEGVGEGVHT